MLKVREKVRILKRKIFEEKQHKDAKVGLNHSPEDTTPGSWQGRPGAKSLMLNGSPLLLKNLCYVEFLFHKFTHVYTGRPVVWETTPKTKF